MRVNPGPTDREPAMNFKGPWVFHFQCVGVMFAQVRMNVFGSVSYGEELCDGEDTVDWLTSWRRLSFPFLRILVRSWLKNI